eukprot:1159453-Pelagomonas_calceolata.AAC.7
MKQAIPEAHWLTPHPSAKFHSVTAHPSMPNIEPLEQEISISSINAHTNALRQGQPIILPSTNKHSHLKSKPKETSPTQVAAWLNTKMTLHYSLAQPRLWYYCKEGADACACAAALTDTTDFALPDARDPFHDFYWLRLKSSHGRNGDPHHPHTAPIHYLTNLTDKLKAHVHKRYKLGSADT